jgi:CubicO group peptidase (beta-lactamase class C family)
MARPPHRPVILLSALVALAIGLGALLAPASAAGNQRAVRASQDRVDAYVNKRMDAWSIPGLALAIVEDGQLTLTRGYGLADKDQGRPMTPQTPTAVGSSTKPLTATAIMQLVEAGKVDLDAPVTRYLPWFQLDDPRAAEITVRHLLSHTSGIPASATLTGGQEADALDRRVRALEWEKLRSAPGARWEYANDGFNTLGLIVQVVSGMPYEQYLGEVTAHLRLPGAEVAA